MSITKKILSNTFWQVFGKVFTAMLGIISIKIITGYLSTTDYGTYTTLFEYLSFFAIAADFGLFTIGVREMAEKKHPVDFILGNILSVRLVLIFTTLTIGGLLTQLIPNYQGTVIPEAIWLVVLITSLALINGTLSSVLQYNLKMLAANISLIIGKVVSVSYMLYVIFFAFPNDAATGFYHLLYAGLIGNLIMLVLTYFLVSRVSSIKLRFSKTYITSIVKKAAPYGLALVLSTIYFRIDIILLGILQDLTQAGIYGVPLKLMEIISVIPVFFMNSLLPTLTGYIQESKTKALKTINNSLELIASLAFPILIGGFLLAFPITASISSPQFLSGYHCSNNEQINFHSELEAINICPTVEVNPTFANTTINTPYFFRDGSDLAFKLIILAIFFSFLNTLFTFSLIAFNKQNTLLIVNGIGVTFNLVTNLILIPKFGFAGAATTTIISEIIILLGTYYFFHKIGDVKLNFKNLGLIIFGSLMMGGVIMGLYTPTFELLKNYNIIVLVPLGIVIYGVFLYLTKVINLNRLRTILSPE